MHTIRKRSRNSASIGVTAALLFLLSVPVVAKAEGNMKSLYERLGGYGAISAVVNDFAGKLFTDPEVGAFFKGMGTDTRESFIQKNINLVCSRISDLAALTARVYTLTRRSATISPPGRGGG